MRNLPCTPATELGRLGALNAGGRLELLRVVTQLLRVVTDGWTLVIPDLEPFSMRRTLLLALGLASASALVMPATRPLATLARAGSPLMQQGPADELHRKGHVVRIQIELEQGEP